MKRSLIINHKSLILQKSLISLLILFFGLGNSAGFINAQTATPSGSVQSNGNSIEQTINELSNTDSAGSLQVSTQSGDLENPVVNIESSSSNPSATINNPPIVRKLSKRHFRANERVEVFIDNATGREVNVKIFDSEGKVVNLEDFIIDEGTRKTVVVKPKTHFRPGKYTIEISSGGDTYKQDFTWGVLAINTNKSIYLPNETVKFSMAVLDEKGGMICNAKLELRIKNHESREEILSTENGLITTNPDCLKKEVRLNPDYGASFKVNGVGVYNLNLTATTSNGTYTIDDSFEVRNSVPFDVERIAATRIFPPNTYPVELKIKANQDFSGVVSEIVPGSFAINPANESDVPYTEIKNVSEESVDGVLGVNITEIGKPFSENTPISLEFGQPLEDPSLEKIYKHFGLAGHDGVDFATPEGTEILAVDGGEIVLAGAGAYGTTVVIQHSWGRTYYGHLSSLKVSEGDKVLKGDIIALSGNTGFTTGPHLHFSLKLNSPNMTNGYFGKTDPLPILGINSSRDPSNQLKLITWNVDIKKGESITLAYTYKAPNISPEFYRAGPLRFYQDGKNIFEEARQFQIAADDINGKTVVASVPRSVLSMITEQVGGSDAHVVFIDSPGQAPSYKYQFLTNGLRILIDKKDGQGFLPAVSQVRTAPEYMKQQGAPGNFVWNSYGLNENSTGSAVLQGFDKQDQLDGSIKLVRTYETFEEGIAEELTESWTIPDSAEEFASKGPKAEYEMTKNRGIVNEGGVLEGTWRMRWEISGISDIVADSSDIKDSEGWPIRTKEYLNGLIKVDVNDFDNLYDTPMFTFSEVGTNNKAEILFFKDGTTGDRLIDPTIVASSIAQGWNDRLERGIHYNGSNFFVFYDKGSTSVFFKAASTIAGLASASEQTLIDGTMSTGWDIFMINDTKFDIVFADETTNTLVIVRTCNISGTTISCNVESASRDTSQSEADLSIVRTSDDRIWVMRAGKIYSADDTGDSENITAFTERIASTSQNGDENNMIPYASGNKLVAIRNTDPGGPNSDGLIYITCDFSGGCTNHFRWVNTVGPTQIHMGGFIRISDTDFRYVHIDDNSDVIEAKYDGNITWTAAHATVHTGTDGSPVMFYDRIGNQSYALYVSLTDDQIYYHQKTCTSGSGCTEGSWGTQTDGDNDESDVNSSPITQMHETPDGSSRTAPREFPWCYLSGNLGVFDVVCGNVNLAEGGAGTPTLDQLLRHGGWFSGGVEQSFTF